MTEVIVKTEIFNGTPAQFFAVLQEYETDCRIAGVDFYVDLMEPVREVQRHNHFYRGGYATERESALLPDSPRVVARIGQGLAPMVDITAIREHGTSRLILRVIVESWTTIEPIWSALIDYIKSHAWIGGTQKHTGAKKSSKPGRKTLACNAWLDIMVNEKNVPIGSYSETNKLFQMWKKLWSLETGKDADNLDVLADPWRSFMAAAGKK